MNPWTLWARAKTEGKQPDNRDDFDPSQYYREHEGEDVVVIDSNNIEDLPEGWKNALKRPVDTEDESGGDGKMQQTISLSMKEKVKKKKMRRAMRRMWRSKERSKGL